MDSAQGGVATSTVEMPDFTGKSRRLEPHERKALQWMKKKKGKITPEELVEWDRRNGKKLFTWDDEVGAQLNRLQEARAFFNRFRAKFDGMRVRAFIHIDKDEEADIDESGYRDVRQIAEHPGMRAQVIAELTSRMKSIAAELKMWQLRDEEREKLFSELESALVA